jgi:superfamily II DNA/RNA helicase
MGFEKPSKIQAISLPMIIRDIQKNRDDCQILLFSATYDENVKQFTTRVVSKANQMFVKKEDLSFSACLQTTLAFKENDLQLFANKMQVMLGWVWYWRPYNSV